MKVSGLRFTIITILILLIPIYANWKLLINGEKTEGIVIKTSKEDTGQFYSFYSIIRYKVKDKYHRLKGPENIEYPNGKTFTILYYPKNPENAIIYNIKGVCLISAPERLNYVQCGFADVLHKRLTQFNGKITGNRGIARKGEDHQ